MERVPRTYGSVLVIGIGLVAMASVTFFLADAGINPLSDHVIRGVNPDRAPSLAMGILFLVHALVAVVSSEFEPLKGSSSARRRRAADPFGIRRRAPFTAFVREPWYRVLSVGPIWALLGVIAVFIWHAFADGSGVPGTVWGDLTQTPLSALALLFGLWATANFSLTLGAIADGFHRTLWVVFLVTMVLLAVLTIVISVIGSNILTMSPIAAVTVTAICLLVTTAVLIPARLFAVARARTTKRIDDAGLDRLRSLQRALAPGETLMLYFADRENPTGQMLAATNQRVLLAAPERPGRIRIIDQAQPGQLRGASGVFRGWDFVTSIQFRDRPDMELPSRDSDAGEAFAEALNTLATTGRLPQEAD